MRARLLDAWAAQDPSVSRFAMADSIGSKTRIAVLPFQAVGSLGGADYFADGVVDELITTLGQVSQLLVAGRTSSFHYRNCDLALPDIADALGVGHLVEGSVQRQGERVRIFVRLIDGGNGFETWGHRYDGSLDDIFALQESVAQAVTSALSAALGVEMAAPLVRGMTHSKAVYDLFLQGRALCTRIFGDGALENGAPACSGLHPVPRSKLRVLANGGLRQQGDRAFTGAWLSLFAAGRSRMDPE
jgi:TolB-like protein